MTTPETDLANSIGGNPVDCEKLVMRVTVKEQLGHTDINDDDLY